MIKKKYIISILPKNEIKKMISYLAINSRDITFPEEIQFFER